MKRALCDLFIVVCAPIAVVVVGSELPKLRDRARTSRRGSATPSAYFPPPPSDPGQVYLRVDANELRGGALIPADAAKPHAD